MDKTWIYKSRNSQEYISGVDLFIDFARQKENHKGMILCPCTKCGNVTSAKPNVVKDHLIMNGFLRGYTRWIFHGEFGSDSSIISEDSVQDNSFTEPDDMQGLIHDVFSIPINGQDGQGISEDPSEINNTPNLEANRFYEFLRDAEQEVYPGCKNFTKLSFLVHLNHMKCLNGWSNSSFTMLLNFLKLLLPDGAHVPKSFYETKKYIGQLGLSYEKIDACPNDCMLFWKDRSNDTSCSICGASRWKINMEEEACNRTQLNSKKRKISAKILRYFPLKPRLQRLFMSQKTACDMTWHEKERTKDGILRHPADSIAWKDFDSRYPLFSSDPRNVRLGLASDGVNPFRTLSVTYSTWPVVLMPYNLPPWMCMKQPYIMLSLLIPGPTAPGNDIDVYLQPLIEDLRELWEVGIETYDAANKQNFQMYASLMWTINDFPAYANLSGWSTKGKLACPSCNKDTNSFYLKYGRKFCYMGHRRFLEANHRFRYEKQSFDGNQEFRQAPIPPSGTTILRQLEGSNFSFEKNNQNIRSKKRTLLDDVEFYNWKKRSIFFSLPYWEHNLMRHNLDVMHIEKNICDNILGTLLNTEGKTKDNLKTRQDLKALRIRPELHPQQRGANTAYLPPACYTLSQSEKENFCKVLKKVRLPDGYASNISRRVDVKQRKIFGLKTHDCHIIMHQLLPLAVRKTLPRNVSSLLIELCAFFRLICSKVIKVEEMELTDNRIGFLLCRLERILPPSFFTVMVHLTVHLAYEAKICGPVHYRWMYPIERYLGTLKSYVRNRACPEGSIAEGYIADECLTFCSRYLQGVETKLNRPTRNNDTMDIIIEDKFSMIPRLGRPLGKIENLNLDDITWAQAHRLVLFNCDIVNPFIEEHATTIKKRYRRSRLKEREIKRIQNLSFHDWFKSHVEQLEREGNDLISEEIRWLARGPNSMARRFKGYNIHGFRFHTKWHEQRRKTQNSGVVVTAMTSSFSSSRDKNPIIGDVTYYGVLTDIIELNYYEKFKVVLFRCDWVDVVQGRGIKQDELGFTLVNFSHKLQSTRLEDEPFILASDARQVFYVQDLKDEQWSVVIKNVPRDLFDMGDENHEFGHAESLVEPLIVDDNIDLVRNDVAGTIVEASLDVEDDYQVEENYDSNSSEDETLYDYFDEN